MTENLFQFIWKNQYFNPGQLKTIQDETIQIIHPGQWNKGQGPDFLNARIRIGDTVFVGSVELHLKTSDWDKHGHQSDPNYRNVILHVVNEHDTPHSQLPLIELGSRISRQLLDRYQLLMVQSGSIPCNSSIHQVSGLVWTSWKERLLTERLMQRTQKIFTLLETNNYHWEETLWWLLARNFGMTANTDAFEALGRSIPVNLLAKHRNQIHQLEALLLGQCNLLNGDFSDHYAVLLQKEYSFLKQKYSLQSISQQLHFLRMRPSNFPTVRLAQLAMLVSRSEHMLSRMIETVNVLDIYGWLDITANDFWHYHYQLNEASAYKPKHLGKTMADSVLLNTLIPVLFAYGHYHRKDDLKTRAFTWLEGITPEQNSIIRQYRQLNITVASAFDSQALLELNKHYCLQKNCLHCGIGHAILKTSKS